MPAIDHRIVLDAFSDAVVASDRDGHIVYANPAVRALLGWEPAGLVGKPLTTIMPARLHAAHRAGFANYFSTHVAKHVGRSLRVPALRHDGSEIEVELTFTFYRDADGRELVVGSLRDLRDRVELERQLMISRYMRAATRMAVRLTERLDLHHVLDTAVDSLVQDFDGALARIWLVEKTPSNPVGLLRLAASSGLSRNTSLSSRATIDVASYPYKVGIAARTRQPVVKNDIREDPEFDQTWVRNEGLVAAAVFPLLIGGELRGVLASFYRRALEPEIIDLLVTLSTMIATTINDVQLHHRAEIERNRMRTLLQQAPAAFAVVRGPDHVYELSNPANDKLAGRPIPIGVPVRQAIPEIAEQGLLPLLDRVYRTGDPFVAEEVALRLPSLNGGGPSEVFLNGMYQPLRDATGRIEGIVAFAYDVTNQVRSRRRAEALAEDLKKQTEALAESEARARRLQDSGVLGVVFWNRKGDLLDANDAFLQIVGYTREDLVEGRVRWRDMTPAEFAPLDEKAFLEMEQSGISRPYEKEYIHKDGHRVPILLGVAFWEGSTSEGVAWILDITDRKRLERQREDAVAALEESQSQLRALLDHAPATVYLKDLSGRYILANRAAAMLLHRTPEELLGKTDHDLVTESADALRAEDLRVLSANAPIETEDSTVVGGRARTAHTIRFPVRAADGTIYATGGFSVDVTERKQLEDAFRHQSSLTRTITENATAGLFLLDERQHCTFMNPAAVAMTQFSLEEVRGRPLHDLVHASHADHSECRILRSIPRGERVEDEDMFLRKDGTSFPVAFIATPIVEGGSPIGTVVEVRDITEEKKATDALTMQARVLQSMAEGVSVWDDNGAIVYTNAAEDRMFGYEPGELVGTHVTMRRRWSEQENERFERELTRDLSTKGMWSGEWENVRKDGTLFATRVRITALDRSGRRYLVCVQGDITRQRKDLADADFLARVSAFVASSVDLVSTVEGVTRLVVPERSDWCEIHLRSAEGPFELAAVAHRDPSKAEPVREIHRRFPEGGTAGTLDPNSLDSITELDGASHPTSSLDERHREMRELGATSFMIIPLVLQNTTIGAIRFAMAESGRRFEARDLVTARELARRVGVAIDKANLFEMIQRERRRAEEANRAKDELLSVTSHELRTPLNAILGWSSMLRAGGLTEEKQARAVESIERNARVQAQLVEDILDVSRVITGKLRLSVAPVEPWQVVEAALDVVRPAAEAKGVRLEASLDRDCGTVNGDASRLQQVCWNLLSNAVKFTPTGGHVDVRLQRRDGEIEIVISDSGQGIEASFLPHVFQPFRQQDASITRAHGGLGLGLAIVKHLVELHGGRIEVESEGVGKGATFRVHVPVFSARPRAARSQEAAAARTSSGDTPLECPVALHGLDVLIVDDEQDARELLQSIMEQCRAHVTTVASASEALDVFRRRAPDVLVSDIGMVGESGYDLIRRVRELSPEEGGRVPAVALTAYASSVDRTRALMEGFTAHARKPIEPQELVAVVASLASHGARR